MMFTEKIETPEEIKGLTLRSNLRVRHLKIGTVCLVQVRNPFLYRMYISLHRQV